MPRTITMTQARPRYMAIADQLADQIQRGIYRVGDPVPSIRAGRQVFRVSAGTLLEAYRQLEDRGYIRARPQSGYYVRPLPGSSHAAPRATTTCSSPKDIEVSMSVALLRQMSDRKVLQLGAAVPDAIFQPTHALNQRLARAVRFHEALVHRYNSPVGLPELRRQIARLMTQYSRAVSADELIVTNGCTEAMSLCLRAVTEPGDVVAIESPAYYGLLITLKGLGLKALPIATSPVTGMSIDALKQAAKQHRIKAVVVTPSFSNPTGALMPEQSRRELVAWSARTRTSVIEDDIYGELHFDDQRPRPLITWSEHGLIQYCCSTSKTISAGFRVGWCMPGKFLPIVEELKAGVNPSSNFALQHALADFLESGGVHKHLRRIRRVYRDQIDRFCDSVTRYFPAETCLHRPAGGHLLWIELPEAIDTRDVFTAALTKQISIAPGALFSPEGHFTNCMRLNCAVEWKPQVDAAIATLGQIITGLLDRPARKKGK